MAKKSIQLRRVTEHIDYETGEIRSKTIETSKIVETEPGFVKLYLEHVSVLAGLPRSHSSIMFMLLQKMDYNGQIVVTGGVKHDIAKHLDIARHTIEKALGEFVAREIFVRRMRGVYMANPYLFGRGKWSDIKKIRASIEYSDDGIQFNMESDQDK